MIAFVRAFFLSRDPRHQRHPNAYVSVAFVTLLTVSLILILSSLGCASMNRLQEQPEVSLVNLTPLPGNGIEQQFEVTLRILNPNDVSIAADGLDVILDVNGQRLGRALSSESFEIPELSDGTVTLVATTHLLNMVRQAVSLSRSGGRLDYNLKGRIRLQNSIGWVRFTKAGSLIPDAEGN